MKTPAFIKQLQIRRSIARRKLRLRTLARRKTLPRTTTNRVSSRLRTHRKLARVFSVCLAAIVVLSSTLGTVFALDEATLERYGLNGVYWYDATGGDDCLPITNGGNVTIIGDSITVGSESALKEALPQAEIYAQVSKRFGKASDDPIAPTAESVNPSGISIAKYLMAENKVQNTVVFALGTNSPGAVSDEDINTLLTLFGNDRTIFFVTNFTTDPHSREYQAKYPLNNEKFRAAAENANVQVIDWAGAISGDPHKYLNSDGVHPNAEGQKLWADLISKAVGGSGSMTAGPNGNYTNYAGDRVFSDADIAQLEANIPFYEQAIAETGASEYGITWQILAAIHYAEHGLGRDNPSNGQGAYQLYSYTNGGTNSNSFRPAGPLSDEEFLRQTKIALEVAIIPNVSGGKITNDDDIKRLFYRYNGATPGGRYETRALAMGFTLEQARNGEGSAYVMNRYDAQRDPNSPEMNPNWRGGFSRDKHWDPNFLWQPFGTYTVYKAIGGASSCGAGGAIGGGLNKEQAKKIMDDYIANAKCTGAEYGDIGCQSSCAVKTGDSRTNCVTFVKYFLQRFTTVGTGYCPSGTGNGGSVVSNLTGTAVEANGKTFRVTATCDTSKFEFGGFEPRPYAVFSTEENSFTPCGNHKCGHTGIVLGIDEANDKIFIGQVGCNTPFTAPLVTTIEYSLSDYKSGNYWYAYIDKMVNLDKINEVVQR